MNNFSLSKQSELNLHSFTNTSKEYFYQNLSSYEQEAKELTHKTEIIFKEEFINKLKESIDNTKQQIH
ncbi:MAG: hypothetical protein Q8789_02500, partial [Sweet potato little leaf phytoplasma]|nr:hypothetical protein [Sweet potato little leaf phytoplasma]